MDIDDMDNLGVAGLVLALVGSLLALIPSLERLLAFGPAWQEPLLTGLVAAAGLAGVFVATQERPATGGIITGVAGIVLAILGPTAPGILAVLGGTLLYAASQEEGPATYEGGGEQPSSSEPQA